MTETERALQEENQKLKTVIEELEQTSKLLIRRDIDLRSAYEELKALDREKSEFISIAAHQLRTPLTSVRFVHQLLSDTILADGQEQHKKILETATDSVNRMFKTIDELLKIDALDYDKVTLKREPIDFESMFRNISEILETHINDKKLHVSFENNVGHTVVWGDTEKITDAVMNVFDNAVKYTPEGGSVAVCVEIIDADCCIKIHDNGIGVLEKDRHNLFKKFSRFDNAKLVDANGSGLGLYISHKIIESHGGTISYESNQPTGSSFIIRIPLK